MHVAARVCVRACALRALVSVVSACVPGVTVCGVCDVCCDYPVCELRACYTMCVCMCMRCLYVCVCVLFVYAVQVCAA